MILVIDNYDSFTYNLVHYLGELGAKLTVRRNDKITLDEIRAMKPEAIVLSPGPCTPNEAGVCLDIITELGAETPILGVCLGHQAIGQAYGGDVVRAPKLMHGKLSEVRHQGQSVFRGINEPFMATRYHSLTIAPESDAELADRHRQRGRRRHHGRDASRASGAWRAVPSRKHRVGARQGHPAQFPQHRGGVECAPRQAGVRRRWLTSSR